MYWALIILYIFFLTFILVYSITQISLTALYIKARKRNKQTTQKALDRYPVVTVQLPVYNEKYVIERLIEAVTKFEYPKDKLEIQVLDDSSDETVSIISHQVQHYQSEGFDIQHIQRDSRKDFKAGALKYGLEISKGEFVAIFDADFVPATDFLLRTIPYFEDKKIGVVQTRWGHINENYSLLTKLQSFALNAHFTIEQSARNSASHFINFNGTAGIWRKKTIEESGGWEGDTLTEDLDLSYRAQLKGWKFKYLEEVISPAELPAEMNALKSQQFRWAKGAAECTRKNLSKVFKSSDLKTSTKIHAFFHLMNSFIWVCILFSALCLMPIQYILKDHPELNVYFGFFVIFEASFFLLFFYYFTANYAASPHNKWWQYLLFAIKYPAFLTVSMGISIYNAIGVIEGYLGKKSPFVRTPKFNITHAGDSIRSKSYVKMKLSIVSFIELVCAIYFGYSCYLSIELGNYAVLIFNLMMTLGISSVFILSTFHFYKANKVTS